MAKTSSERSMKWNRAHQSIVNARIKDIKARNPEKYAAIDKAYRVKNAARIKKYRDDYRIAHPEKELEWKERYMTSAKGKATKKRTSHEQYARLRKAILAAYSNSSPRCACCGETREEFLTIDHVNGDGAKQRREGKRGIAFYLWLVKSDFPEGFRVLCMNCNFSLGMRGYCPHQHERDAYTTVSSPTVTNIDPLETYTATSKEN